MPQISLANVTLVALVTVVTLVGILWFLLRRNRRKHTAQRTTDKEVSDRAYHELMVTAERTKSDHTATLEAHRTVITSMLQQHEFEIEKLRNFASTGMKDERISRDRIITELKRANVHGFVATNIRFLAGTGTNAYIHQVDHLVVTPNNIFIIEAKRWAGVIFHGTRAESAAHPIEFLPALQNLPKGSRYVVSIKDEMTRPLIGYSGTGIQNSATQEPVAQVRKQAAALSEALSEQGICNGKTFIDTCVYYSHRESILASGCKRIGSTHVTHTRGLSAALAALNQKAADIPIESIGDWATAHGADVYGLGRFAQQWSSLVPVQAASVSGRQQ